MFVLFLRFYYFIVVLKCVHIYLSLCVLSLCLCCCYVYVYYCCLCLCFTCIVHVIVICLCDVCSIAYFIFMCMVCLFCFMLFYVLVLCIYYCIVVDYLSRTTINNILRSHSPSSSQSYSIHRHLIHYCSCNRCSKRLNKSLSSTSS